MRQHTLTQHVYAQEQPRITICVLLYGDYPEIATRCLKSIYALNVDWELRIGLNAVSAATEKEVTDFDNHCSQQGHRVLIYKSTTNRGKYPMMRWMFHDPNNPIETNLIMWFDDDSYIKTPTENWLHKVETVLTGYDMCGHVRTCKLAGNQVYWCQLQTWYRGKTFDNPHTVRFAVGGWFVTKHKVIKQLNWPPTNIIHRGGDVMLGEALRQNDFKLLHLDEGVAINADMTGISHDMPRRGLNSLPVGTDYEPTLTEHVHFSTKDIEPVLLDYPGM